MKKNIITTNKFDVERFTRWLTTEFTIDQLYKITQGKFAHNSLLAMRKDWLLFVEFSQRNGYIALPSQPHTVRLFLDKVSIERKFSTLKRYNVTISNIHRILGYSDPTTSHEVSLLIQEKKLEKQGDERATIPFTKAHLDSLAKLLHNNDDALAIRNLAIYSVMFECALKRSELRDLNFTQIKSNKLGGHHLIDIIINESRYQLSNQTSSYLNHWISLIKVKEGPVFRSIDRYKNIATTNLNDSSIFRVLKNASSLLGLPSHVQFSGQSARVGAVKELYKQGFKIDEIQEFGRWNSPVMPNQYLGNKNRAEQGKIVFKSFSRLGFRPRKNSIG